jgi:hypothetical protein
MISHALSLGRMFENEELIKIWLEAIRIILLTNVLLERLRKNRVT